MPVDLFDDVVMPALFITNLFFGILLISKKKRLAQFFSVLFLILIVIYGANFVKRSENNLMSFMRFGIYFLFYIIVSVEIIKQVLKTKSVSKNVIIGLMSGYLSIGLIAFFVFVSIEIATPDSFKGLMVHGTAFSNKADSLLYYSYITLLSIGYGDIVPVTAIAQKAAILVGVLGQFYIVIVTTLVIEKYIFYRRK
ncbi:ion channel [uncultured Algibacter sp.]|uniref:ion channel n=1 Tax=uncultured Algibacter sp. TaxID=298659 RepID=UPI00260EB88E|nr:ion channel [uncultured Algibacter sp.]